MKINKSTIIMMAILTLGALVAAPLLYVFVGPHLNQTQIETLIILVSVMGGSVLFCFLVGQVTHNNSQMDKLWSILPAVYTWVCAFKDNLNPRLVLMAVLVTLWCLRLTMNFARKGAYKLKFWEGEEDYRWKVLREDSMFKGHKIRWIIFNLFFISLYQNFVVLAITFPSLAVMGSTPSLGWADFLVAGIMLFFIIYETIADEQQWKFQIEKWAMINSGKKLDELPTPYNLGFNTIGLWNRSRHPNYLGEQAIWLTFYFFTLACLTGFSWSMAGGLMLVVLFAGSSQMQESISTNKYPLYSDYCQKCSKFLPFKKYRG